MYLGKVYLPGTFYLRLKWSAKKEIDYDLSDPDRRYIDIPNKVMIGIYDSNPRSPSYLHYRINDKVIEYNFYTDNAYIGTNMDIIVAHDYYTFKIYKQSTPKRMQEYIDDYSQKYIA